MITNSVYLSGEQKEMVPYKSAVKLKLEAIDIYKQLKHYRTKECNFGTYCMNTITKLHNMPQHLPLC